MSLEGKIGARVLLQRAQDAEQRGDYARASEHYRDALAEIERPAQAPILHRMGMLAYARNDFKSARSAYEQSIAIAPGDPTVLMNLGNTLHRLQEPEAAKAAYEKALEVSNRRPDVLYNYAVFVADADPRRAAGLIRACLDAPVGSLQGLELPLELPLRFLVHLSARHGLVDETSLYFDELEKRPWRNLKPWIMNQHAILLSRGGRHADALAIYRKILDAWPGETDARFNLGMALVRLDRHEDALAEFRAVPLPQAHYGIAYVHELNGRLPDAVREYRVFLEKIAAEPADPAKSAGVDFMAPWIDHARQLVAKNG